MVGARGKMVVVPDNYAGRYGKVQYNLMKKLGYTGGDHNIIRHMDWGYRNYHKLKPNDQFSSSIILKCLSRIVEKYPIPILICPLGTPHSL